MTDPATSEAESSVDYSSPPPSSSPSSSSFLTGSGKDPVTERSNKRGKRNSNGKHPGYRGVRTRKWRKWVSEIRELGKKNRIWLGTFSTPEMAARAHDAAEISIKGSSAAILNFPGLAGSLPRPDSNSPRDVQAAAAKATSMEITAANATLSSSSSSSSTSSLSSILTVTQSALTDEASEPEELSEIVELPSLGTSYESPELRDEFVFGESRLLDGWIYNTPWDHCNYAGDQISFTENFVAGGAFEALLWQH